MQMQSFNFIFALNMLDPILSIILKVSSSLQSKELDLLTAVGLIKSLKLTITRYRSEDGEYDKIYDKTIHMCDENNIEVPKVKKRKVCSKVDDKQDNQYFEETKKLEMKHSGYFFALDEIMSGINSHFHQENLELIEGIGNLVNLNPTEDNMKYFKIFFNTDVNGLKAEIKLLNNMTTSEVLTMKGTSTKIIHNWVHWLSEGDRSTIFNQFSIILKLFLTVPVTSCSCERSFSKLSIVKTKLRSMMNQERLDALLYMFVEQEVTNSINYDEVIEEFKILITGERRLIL